MNYDTSVKVEATLAQANLSARRAADANQDSADANQDSTSRLKLYIKPTRVRSWSLSSSSSSESYGYPLSPTSPILRWLETPGRGDEGVLKAMEHVQFGWWAGSRMETAPGPNDVVAGQHINIFLTIMYNLNFLQEVDVTYLNLLYFF